MDKVPIRPIVICLFRRGARILISETYDAARDEWYARPLGGGIEFGEFSRDALVREIREELGAEIENAKLVGVLESMWDFDADDRGHEVVFVYDAEFRDKTMYDRPEIPYREEGIDLDATARWLSPEELKQRNIRLVPDDLPELLSNLYDRSVNAV